METMWEHAGVNALISIAASLRETRAAQSAVLLNTAAHVQTHAREAWLANLDLTEEQTARVRTWRKWLDDQPVPRRHGEELGI